MTIQELLVIMQNRVLTLNEAKKIATLSGDIQKIIEIDSDLLSTSISIEQLKEILQS